MVKTAEELKKGDKFVLGGKKLFVENIELSDVGKQGVKKCRIVAKDEKGENIIIIRPSNYPFNVAN